MEKKKENVNQLSDFLSQEIVSPLSDLLRLGANPKVETLVIYNLKKRELDLWLLYRGQLKRRTCFSDILDILCIPPISQFGFHSATKFQDS